MLPALFTEQFPTTNRLSTLFDHLIGDGRPMTPTLPFAMWEDEEAVRVELDAPGVRGEDIDVSVHENTLAVRGERKCKQEGGYDARAYGRFEHRLTLPAVVDAAGVEASLADGVLTVTLPKSEAAKPRKIAVKSA